MAKDLIGHRLSRFELERIIGEGAQATVYKAYQPRLDRSVAVKVLHGSYRETLKRFEREAKTIARLQHPNIMAIYEYGEEDGYPYIAMEYVAGGTLQGRLLGQPLDWQTVLRLVIPVADALHYAHEQDLVHRDIKPSNILMPQEDWPLLADFGLVKARAVTESSLTETGLVMGTPAYMSPEQANGEPVDARTDMYALGIIIFEMITGRLPFEHKNPNMVMVAHVSEPMPAPTEINPECPPLLEKVILRATRKSPDNRYPNMEAMVTALKHVIGSSTVSLDSRSKTPEKAKTTSETIHIPQSSMPSMELAKLLVLDGNATIDLLDPESSAGLIIGRTTSSDTADIDLLPYNALELGISRRHARLTKQENEWLIEDLDSLNYTYVNEKQLIPGSPQPLGNGDVIHCGDLFLVFIIS